MARRKTAKFKIIGTSRCVAVQSDENEWGVKAIDVRDKMFRVMNSCGIHLDRFGIDKSYFLRVE